MFAVRLSDFELLSLLSFPVRLLGMMLSLPVPVPDNSQSSSHVEQAVHMATSAKWLNGTRCRARPARCIAAGNSPGDRMRNTCLIYLLAVLILVGQWKRRRGEVGKPGVTGGPVLPMDARIGIGMADLCFAHASSGALTIEHVHGDRFRLRVGRITCVLAGIRRPRIGN